METFLNLMDKGGIIFTLLFLLSIITIAIVTLKYFEIFILKKLDFSRLSNFLDSVTTPYELIDVKQNGFEKMSNSKKLLMENIVDLINSNQAETFVEQEINILVNKEFKKVNSFLPSLEIISQVSPLIGLLGTVIGMIDSFNELELGGSLVDPSILAGGIWTALLTTAMGLIVAIPALISHYFLDKKVNSLSENFEIIIQRLSKLKR